MSRDPGLPTVKLYIQALLCCSECHNLGHRQLQCPGGGNRVEVRRSLACGNRLPNTLTNAYLSKQYKYGVDSE